VLLKKLCNLKIACRNFAIDADVQEVWSQHQFQSILIAVINGLTPSILEVLKTLNNFIGGS